MCNTFTGLGFVECGVYGRNGQSRGAYVGRRNSYIGSGAEVSTTTTTPAPLTPKEYLQMHGTFSAWSLILVIMSVIVMGLGFYYCILCYPILCRTEKNYRFMDASSTMTGATSHSRSIHSIENFPSGKRIDNFPEKPIDDFIHEDQQINSKN